MIRHDGIDILEVADLEERRAADLRVVDGQHLLARAFEERLLERLLVKHRTHDAVLRTDGRDAEERDVDAELADHADGEVAEKTFRRRLVDARNRDELDVLRIRKDVEHWKRMREHGDVLLAEERIGDLDRRRAVVEVDGAALGDAARAVFGDGALFAPHLPFAHGKRRQVRASLIVDRAAMHERHDIIVREAPEIAADCHRRDVELACQPLDRDAPLFHELLEDTVSPFLCLQSCQAPLSLHKNL